MARKDPNIPEHTHVATLSIYSSEDSPDVWIQVDWDPKLTGKQVHELGYFPAAYKFVQDHVVPMLHEAYTANDNELLEAEAASDSVN